MNGWINVWITGRMNVWMNELRGQGNVFGYSVRKTP
jgi:hypothetical protein